MRITVDGAPVEGGEVPLIDDGRTRQVVAIREPGRTATVFG